VRESSLAEAWFDSDGFNRFRGKGWMKEPCRSCAHQDEDLGGCRCQAYMLAQDAAAADPVCRFSPDHHKVAEAVAAADRPLPVIEHPLVFRDPANSRRLTSAAG
jgi:PqqA peptide cyclase